MPHKTNQNDLYSFFSNNLTRPLSQPLLQHAMELQQKYGLSGNAEMPTVALFGPDGEAVTSEEQLSSKGVQRCVCVYVCVCSCAVVV